MSLTLAQTWVNSTIHLPQARANALSLLDQVEVGVAGGTWVIGPHLSTSGKCVLGRWDGRELVVLELTREQQRDWSIEPTRLFQELDYPSQPPLAASPEPLVSLEIKHVECKDACDGWAPLTGICFAELQTTSIRKIRNCAVRARYFRPDLLRGVTQMWFSNHDLHSARAEWHFQFPPLFSKENPQTFRGTILVFLQILVAEDWVHETGCRSISNVAHLVLTMK